MSRTQLVISRDAPKLARWRTTTTIKRAKLQIIDQILLRYNNSTKTVLVKVVEDEGLGFRNILLWQNLRSLYANDVLPFNVVKFMCPQGASAYGKLKRAEDLSIPQCMLRTQGSLQVKSARRLCNKTHLWNRKSLHKT